MTGDRISDGPNFRGYIIRGGGARIILPMNAIRDLEACMLVRAYGYDPEGSAVLEWKRRVEQDLNINHLWEKYVMGYDPENRGSKFTVLIKV